MKDKLFRRVDSISLCFYRLVMWAVYQYKSFMLSRGAKDISLEYRKEIRKYWSKYYKRISIRDFKWFYTKTKINDVRFIPDAVFYSKIEPYFNDIKTIDAYSNKCYYDLFFQNYQVPYIIVNNINGVYMDHSFRLLSLAEVIQLCLQEEEIIIKPAIKSGGGRNITFLKMKQDMGARLEVVLDAYKKDFVIQRLIKQHEELSKMNPTSINTARVQTFLFRGEVYVLSFLLRVGITGSRLDNVSGGGLGISVKEGGILDDFAFDSHGVKHYCHPGGYFFKDRRMPSYDKIIRYVKELHPRFAKFGFIGWDIAVDQSGEPVIIEFNLNDTSVRAPQLHSGPLFKDLTEDVLVEVFHKKKPKGKIKILVISTVGLSLYGMTSSIMNYYRSMDKSDLLIHFVVTHKVPDRLRTEICHNGGKIYKLASRYRYPLRYMGQLARVIRKEKYDIVHAHGNSATLGLEMGIARLCKVKTRIAHCHNSTCEHRYLHRMIKPIFNRCYTQGFACSMQAGRWLFGQKKFTVINNGIPLAKYVYDQESRDKYRKLLGYQDKNKVIGHIGHFSYQKNQSFLIHIMAELYKRDSSYRLLLIGDGEQLNAAKKLVSKLGLDKVVCFYGETLEVPKLLQAMDIFVFPSNFEGLGMVLIEAQAAGLPCVTSDVVPLEAKITPKFEYLSLKASKERWIEKILEFGDMDRRSYGKEVIEAIEESDFNIRTEAEKLTRLYHSYAIEN